MTIELTRENVTTAMQKVVKGNEGKVYRREDYIDPEGYQREVYGCSYTKPDRKDGEDAAPSCIVGSVLHEIDPDILNHVYGGEWERCGEGYAFKDEQAFRYLYEGLAADGIVTCDDNRLVDAISAAQRMQDEGERWGDALLAYLRKLA